MCPCVALTWDHVWHRINTNLRGARYGVQFYCLQKLSHIHLGKPSFCIHISLLHVYLSKKGYKGKEEDACQEDVTLSRSLPKVKAKKCSSFLSPGSVPPRGSKCQTATPQASIRFKSNTVAITGSWNKLELPRLAINHDAYKAAFGKMQPSLTATTLGSSVLLCHKLPRLNLCYRGPTAPARGMPCASSPAQAVHARLREPLLGLSTAGRAQPLHPPRQLQLLPS